MGVVAKNEFALELAGFLLPYQSDFVRDTAQITFFSASRRIGKTFSSAFKSVSRCIEKINHRVWYSGADEEGGEDFIEECKYWLRFFNASASEISLEEGGEEIEYADEEKGVLNLTIRFANGSRITVLSSNPKRFRGKGGDIILDEFAHHPHARAMWKAALPAALVWGYNLTVISTHNGKFTLFNAFVERIRSGKNKFKASLHEVTIRQAVDQGLYDKITGRETTPEERDAWIQELIDACETPEDAMEEFFCKPQDSKDPFLPLPMILRAERKGILADPATIPGSLYLGYDIARKKHLSVIYVLQEIASQLVVREIRVMEKMRFEDQKKILFAYLKLPTLVRASIDASGLGMNLAEDAQIEFGTYKVEAVTFGNALKATLSNNLYKEFDTVSVFIPEDDVQRRSLNSIKKMVTGAGNIRFDVDAEESDKKENENEVNIGHADHFWALALAVNSARNTPAGIPPVTTRSQRKDFRDRRREEDQFDDGNNPFRRMS